MLEEQKTVENVETIVSSSEITPNASGSVLQPDPTLASLKAEIEVSTAQLKKELEYEYRERMRRELEVRARLQVGVCNVM